MAASLISFRVRDGNLKRLGLARPASWRKTILWAVCIAVVRIPIGGLFPEPSGPKGAELIAGTSIDGTCRTGPGLDLCRIRRRNLLQGVPDHASG